MIFTEFKNTLTRHEIDTAQTITKGTLVSLDYTTNKLIAGISNSSNILGIAQESGTAGDFIYVATGGTAEGASGLIVGETCWSDSNGVLFPDSTAVANNAGYFVGICVSTTEVRIDMKTFTPIPVVDPGLLQNYIVNAIAKETSDITAWNVYDDSSAIPINGIGGTTSITLTQNLTNPISSTGDFKLTKGVSNLQGEGISYNFSIQPIHLAKILQIEFNAKLFSGTYEKGDIRIYIIQDPNGTPKIIEPIGVELELATAGNVVKHIASFQTDHSELNYSLAIHITSTSTLAYTINFNNFKVWEPTKNIGAIITDWVPYAPTIQGGGTLANIDCLYRRVGSNLEIQGRLNLGTTANLEFRLSLPNGLKVRDSSRLLGHLYDNTSTVSTTKWYFLKGDAGQEYLKLTTGAEYEFADDLYQVLNSDALISNDLISFSALVPIQGWGSNIVMSSDTGDGRVIIAQANGTPTASSQFNPVIFPITIFDTLNSYNSTTGQYTVPISGYYKISSYIENSASDNRYAIYKNGILYQVIGSSGASNKNIFSGIVACNIKDIIDIRPIDAGSGAMGPNGYILFEKISSSSQILARNETIECSYTDNSGLNLTNPGQSYTILFANKKYDSHSIYSAGDFIFPEAGTYLITANVRFESTISDSYRAFSASTNLGQSIGGLLLTPKEYNSGAFYYDNNMINAQIKVVKGEVLKFEATHVSVGTVNIAEARVEICKIG